MNEMLRLDKQNSQSGQALVEYILIIAISVAIILGLMNQLYKPFGEWMKDYMGQYLECLLDMGELPTVGGGSDSGECNSRFQAFSASNGRPPIQSGNSDKIENSNRANQNSSSGGTVGGGETASATMANRASGRSGGTPFPVGGRGGSDGSGSQGAISGEIQEKLPESQYFRLRSSRTTSIANPEVSQRTGLNQSYMVSRKQKSSQSEKFEKLNLSEEVGSETKSKKFMIKPSERKPASVDEDQPWSFSEYLKYGLIILIIVALVLFLGGQILQISKSMEK